MNITSNHFSHYFPRRLYCQPACILGFPTSTEISDAWSITGSGIGSGAHSLKTALGEYYERKHFYTEIIPDTQNSLDYSLNTDELIKFTHAFTQTSCPSFTHDNLLAHAYHLTKAIRISDLTECYIPTACLSLTHYNLGKDNTIYPSKDTCGCSFHWDAKKAIFGAIKECLERQFLIRFWLTGEYLERISAPSIINALTKSEASPLATTLSKSGDIVAFDISDPSFPGRCIIVIYGQKRSTHRVKYCTGMAYSNSRTHGLEKALEELWQTYRFIDLYTSCKGKTNQLKDPYLKHFFDCNTYDTFIEITHCKIVKTPHKRNSNRLTTDALLQTLADKKIHGYLYIKTSTTENKKSIFCKFISPQLFMHMDNSGHINLRNDYSDSFQKNILPDRQKVMVPFP